MAKEKDELISGAELAKRLKVSQPYITKKKDILKNCRYGKKYYFKKCCLALGYDPNNLDKKEISLPKNNKDEKQKDLIVKNENQKDDNVPRETIEQKQINSNDIDTLYNEILEAIADEKTTYDKLKLDGLVNKAKALKEFELATAQRLKNKQLEESLYTYDEIINIKLLATAIFRNGLIDLPNNGAGSLEGLNKKQIKEWLQNYVDDKLEEFNKISEKFE